MIHQVWIPFAFCDVNAAGSLIRAERDGLILPGCGGMTWPGALLFAGLQRGCRCHRTSQKVGSFSYKPLNAF